MSKAKQTKAAIERAMLRALRQLWMPKEVQQGAMPKACQVQLIGLERARRQAGGRHA